ncbi:MAG: M20/M25/M40 family metallo-hydrolase [Gemmatimonadota bacterium]
MRGQPGSVARAAALAVALGAVHAAPAPAVAQEDGTAARGSGSGTLPGFAAAVAGAQSAYEEALRAAVRPDSMARWARALASRPHVAGTEGQRRTRDSVVAWMREAGLEVGYDSLELYMPHPVRVEVSRVLPTPLAFALDEPALAEDPYSGIDPVPVFHAYSGSGSVEAEVIYANYGLAADYRLLDSLGIRVRDRIVIARYGRAFRGIKAREAELRGAAGLLLFNDPAGDGFTRGEVYPEGPMRPPDGIQRGSLHLGEGDPSTPGWPSLPGARRVPDAEMEGVPGIPVVPIGCGAAAELLGLLGGPEPPQDWRGGLDLAYRLGPGPVTVRLEVEMERGAAALHPAWNTIAALRGVEWPDEWVLVGAHRDAWGPGAIDNVSGTASVVAAARAFAAVAAAGWRPRRTVVFATWDAEEWGITGSKEWVDAHLDRLRVSAVAYLNQDAPVSGSSFGAAAAPELAGLVRDVATDVEDPGRGRPVAEAWLERLNEGRADRTPLAEPAVGALGGGSDHEPFYLRLGVPALGFGFGGRGGVYHSMYDTPTWMERFGDPGYAYHAATARLSVTALARLANADVLPFDHAALAAWVGAELRALGKDVDESLRVAGAAAAPPAGVADVPDVAVDAGGPVRRSLADATDAAENLEAAARSFAEARDRRLRYARPDPESSRRLNEELRKVGPELAPAGEGGGWSGNLVVGTDPDNGYASLSLPEARLALRRGDIAGIASALDRLAAALRRAAERVRAAERQLGGSAARGPAE